MKRFNQIVIIVSHQKLSGDSSEGTVVAMEVDCRSLDLATCLA